MPNKSKVWLLYIKVDQNACINAAAVLLYCKLYYSTALTHTHIYDIYFHTL